MPITYVLFAVFHPEITTEIEKISITYVFWAFFHPEITTETEKFSISYVFLVKSRIVCKLSSGKFFGNLCCLQQLQLSHG